MLRKFLASIVAVAFALVAFIAAPIVSLSVAATKPCLLNSWVHDRPPCKTSETLRPPVKQSGGGSPKPDNPNDNEEDDDDDSHGGGGGGGGDNESDD